MKEIPRLHLAHLPTPVEELPRLTGLMNAARLLVKRDDQTGLAFGGNKTRKLEFCAAEALTAGARTLVTCGSIQSNHCRQTAAVAARCGLDCILVINPLPGEDPGRPSANLLLDNLLGAEIVWCERPQRDQALAETVAKATRSGRKPYAMPLGASTPTGALGYVFAMQELAGQPIRADWIISAASSAGSMAGMVLGARLSGYDGKILAISIDVPAQELRQNVARIANGAAELLGEKIRFSPAEILVNDHYLGKGYGILGQPEVEAIRLFARCEGLLLDPVYTSRAAAGMLDLLRQGFFNPTETVLFWHTGGTPALFAEPYCEPGVLY